MYYLNPGKKLSTNLEHWQPLWSGTICEILVECNIRNNSFELAPAFQMSFKDISYLELWQPLCSMEQNHLCNLRRVHHEEQFCEILNLDQWFRRCHFLSRAPAAPLFSGPEPLCNFGRRHHEEQYCEILNWDQWFRRKCCFMVFLI